MPRMHSTLSRGRLFGSSFRPTWVEQEQRQAWALLWKYVEAHYNMEGRLLYHHGGVTHFLLSLGGVHQGDPLGSVLYALAVHHHLVAVANKYRSLPVRVVAYADKVFLLAHQR